MQKFCFVEVKECRSIVAVCSSRATPKYIQQTPICRLWVEATPAMYVLSFKDEALLTAHIKQDSYCQVLHEMPTQQPP